ncbi:YggU family protein [Candidatus Woesearchaeota archaeon]|nr:YggU family protein [Candidatus Woesearchaeota archaeon]
MGPISCLSSALDGSVVMDIEVQPSAKLQGITGINDWRHRLSVSVRAAARHGKANQAVLHVLAKALELKVDRLSITSGHRSRLKSVRVEGTTVEALTHVLHRALEVKT